MNPSLTLHPDEIDDVLYFTRTDSLSDLEATLTELSEKYNSILSHQTSHPSPLSALLAACIDPETKNSPWHYAAANGHLALLTRLHTLLLTSNNNTTTTTSSSSHSQQDPQLAHKTLINAPNAQGNTPLHWAAYNGHLEVVKYLVREAEADMWARNEARHLPLFEAERAERTDVVVFLLEEGGAEVERGGSMKAPTEEDLDGLSGDSGEGSGGVDRVNGVNQHADSAAGPSG